MRTCAEPTAFEGDYGMKKILAALLVISILLSGCGAVAEQSAGAGYTLDRVVILSRHNIRSPLSGSGSLLGDIPGELSAGGRGRPLLCQRQTAHPGDSALFLCRTPARSQRTG